MKDIMGFRTGMAFPVGIPLAFPVGILCHTYTISYRRFNRFKAADARREHNNNIYNGPLPVSLP